MFRLNYQPICDNPIDAGESNGAGYRMCANPAHRQEPSYESNGPVWHNIAEWNKKKKNDQPDPIQTLAKVMSAMTSLELIYNSFPPESKAQQTFKEWMHAVVDTYQRMT